MKTLIAYSIGHAATDLRTSVSVAKRIATQLQLQPVMVQDDVPHYSATQVEAMRQALQAKGK